MQFTSQILMKVNEIWNHDFGRGNHKKAFSIALSIRISAPWLLREVFFHRSPGKIGSQVSTSYSLYRK